MSLKDARASITQGDYREALNIVERYESRKGVSYNSVILKASALQQLKKNDEAEAAFLEAVALNNNGLQAFKGLLKLYKTEGNREKYLAAFEDLVLLYEQNEDLPAAVNEFETATRFFTRANASAMDAFYRLQLPDSPIYPFLRGRMWPVGKVLKEMIDAAQKSLAHNLASLAGRTKMNVSITSTEIAAKQLALYVESNLEELYIRLLDYSDDTSERRQAEADLLNLYVSQIKLSQSKAVLQKKISELVGGMVLFESVSPLAFTIYWEWQDMKTYDEFDRDMIQSFIELFPAHGFAGVLESFLLSKLSPFPITSQDQDVDSGFEDALSQVKDMSLAYRICADICLSKGAWERAIDYSSLALDRAKKSELLYGVSLANSVTHIQLIQAVGYSHHDIFKNSGLATKLFDAVLSKTDSESKLHNQAIVGYNVVKIELGQVSEAKDALTEFVSREPSMLEAVNALGWCMVLLGDYAGAREQFERALGLAQSNSASGDTISEIHWRIGYSYYKEGDVQTAYQRFIQTLKLNRNYAPALTYLGLIYQSQGDSSRAFKCFYSAFESDSGDALAAEQLCTDFAAKGQWDLVDIVATRLLESRSNKTPSWVYRALGYVATSRKDWGKAVLYFQSGLRHSPRDITSWVGLGEAYIYTGRYRSAKKALLRAVEIDDSNLAAVYMQSLSQLHTLDFDESVRSAQRALDLKPDDPALIAFLISNHTKAADYLLSESFLGDAVDFAVRALRLSADELAKRPGHSSVWGLAGVACNQILKAEFHINKVDSADLLKFWAVLQRDAPEEQVKSLLRETMLMCLERSLETSETLKSTRAAKYYNLAVGYHGTGLENDAIAHIKKALTLQSRNPAYWGLYGVIVARSNPRVAQHCFVRGLSLNPRSATIWANLGLLYLEHEDLELASDALDRALMVDPGCGEAWLGSALVEFVQGKPLDKLVGQFERAYLTSPGESRLPKLLFGLISLKKAQDEDKVQTMGVRALEQLLRLDPTHEKALLTIGHLLERSGDYLEAIERLNTLKEYDSARWHSHLGRLNLAAQNFQQAKDHAQACLDLDCDEKTHLGSMLVLALASFFLNDFDSSLDVFSAALEFSESSQEVIVLLTQILWAHGGSEERQVALDKLYESIGEKGSTVQTTLLLGAISLVSNDSETQEAIIQEIQEFPYEKLAEDKVHQLPILASKLQASEDPVHAAILADPASYDLWKQVDAGQALRVAKIQAKDSGVLSHAYSAVGGIENARRAVFYAPANPQAWIALAKEAKSAA